MISKEIDLAVAFLNQGEVIGFPTETVYGLAGNVFSEAAILKIFAVKQRPFFNPLIVHVKDKSVLGEFVSEIPPKASLLADAFWPGPLTLLLKKKSSVSDLITAGKDTVAVRVPNHPMALALLQKLDFPLAAPSANPFGSISPTKAIHVEQYFNEKIPMVLDGGDCKSGIESTIVGFDKEEVVVYRLGAVSLDRIERVVGPVKIYIKNERSPEAPGMMERHYAPRTRSILVDDAASEIEKYPSMKIGCLLFSASVANIPIDHQRLLSVAGNLDEAAANVYNALHELDAQNLDLIIMEKMPDKGIGRSINDRLERATK
jgi:L-threonylcarbamoyladenylate synthase